MTRIWNGCENLFQPLAASQINIREDTAITVNVMNSSSLLISADASRESLKIFVVNLSNPLTEVWLRFGLDATIENAAFILPLRNLFLFTASDLPQIRGNISAIASNGTASVRVCSA